MKWDINIILIYRLEAVSFYLTKFVAPIKRVVRRIGTKENVAQHATFSLIFQIQVEAQYTR